MRRSHIVIGATVLGTAGVLAFQPQPASVESATAATAATSSASRTVKVSSRTGAGQSSGVSGAATGNAISTRYGDVQVRAIVKHGKIVDVEAVQLTDSDQHSVEISDSAAPVLKQEALRQQSAEVDAVSGATYTSAGYADSLQSALDKLGFKATGGARATLQVPS